MLLLLYRWLRWKPTDGQHGTAATLMGRLT
jgi:hypothetical protein